MRFLDNLNQQKKQTIVTFGTSLTAGGCWVKGLNDKLNSLYPGLITTINSGGPGQWSKWGVENLEDLVIKNSPDAVFIEFSANDSVTRFDCSIELAQKNLCFMIDRILEANKNCSVILMTMTPANKHPLGHFSHRTNIESHYEMFRQTAKMKQLLLIDHYPNWLSLHNQNKDLFEQLVPDGIHPTDEGNIQIVLPEILKALDL